MSSETIIILTSTVNIFKVHQIYQTDKEERLTTYLTAIRKWIKTNFKIILVDNSDYVYDEIENSDNFLKLHYNYNNLSLQLPRESQYIIQSNEKGHHEMLSVHYALQNIPVNWNYNKVFKLTGRYYIPNFESHIEKIRDDQIFYIQNNIIRCELYGCCKSKLNDIFQLPTEKDKRSILEYIKKNRIEKIIEQYKTSDIIHYFPVLKVDAVIKGSRNTIMNHI